MRSSHLTSANATAKSHGQGDDQHVEHRGPLASTCYEPRAPYEDPVRTGLRPRGCLGEGLTGPSGGVDCQLACVGCRCDPTARPLPCRDERIEHATCVRPEPPRPRRVVASRLRWVWPRVVVVFLPFRERSPRSEGLRVPVVGRPRGGRGDRSGGHRLGVRVRGLQLLLHPAVRYVRDHRAGARRRAVRLPRPVRPDLGPARARESRRGGGGPRAGAANAAGPVGELVVLGPGTETSSVSLVSSSFRLRGGGCSRRMGTASRAGSSGGHGRASGELRPDWDPRSPAPRPPGCRSASAGSIWSPRPPRRPPPLTAAESRILEPSATSSRSCSSATGCCGRRPKPRSTGSGDVRRSLLAAVSHDLRSPLAAIKASVTDLLDAEVARAWPDRARRSHDRPRERPAEHADREPARHVPDRGRGPASRQTV